jgi:hypothetical protein
LYFTEFLKYILIMEQRVCKFFLELVSLQKPRNALFQTWNLQELVNCWSFCWIALQHHRH